MSKVERKEYQETKVMRTLSPTRYGSSSQNISEFDNNLDHLLTDLQNTVPRPGSSLRNGTSNSYLESKTVSTSDSGYRSNSLNRIGSAESSKPMADYSTNDSYTYTAPDGTKHIKTVKKESYSYKTSGSDVPPEKMRMQNNISQLDSLLDDLQQVKQPQHGHISNVGSKTGYQEYSTSKIISGKKSVDRDVLNHGDGQMRSSSLDRSKRDGSLRREYYQHNEGTYGDIKSTRTTSPSPTRSNTSTLSKQTKMTNVQQYPLEVVETTTSDINPEILASLDPKLLPSGNTKVTTTIKTYTYEIPGGVDLPDSDKLVYSPNQTMTTPSKSFVYNKYEDDTMSRNYQTNTTTSYRPKSPYGDQNIIKETITTRNYQPSKPHPDQKHTYVYNENTTTRNYNDYPNGHVHSPPQNVETYIIRENRNVHHTNRSDSPDHTSLPPVNTTIQRFDSMTNLNARQYPETETFDPKHPPHPQGMSPYGSPHQSPPYADQYGHPPEVNVTYKYRSTSNTNYKTGYPAEPYDNEPLLPRKFPTSEGDIPPKKLDDLMANIGNEPPTNAYNAGWKYHEEELAQQRKVDSLKAQHDYESNKKDDRKEVQKTKNVSGPPVYYPPGHELFAKKEEAGGGAWRAEGAMAKERGSYKYEAESKSRTKSSSGAAIVPVCLPLCCGLPCTII